MTSGAFPDETPLQNLPKEQISYSSGPTNIASHPLRKSKSKTQMRRRGRSSFSSPSLCFHDSASWQRDTNYPSITNPPISSACPARCFYRTVSYHISFFGNWIRYTFITVDELRPICLLLGDCEEGPRGWLHVEALQSRFRLSRSGVRTPILPAYFWNEFQSFSELPPDQMARGMKTLYGWNTIRPLSLFFSSFYFIFSLPTFLFPIS